MYYPDSFYGSTINTVLYVLCHSCCYIQSIRTNFLTDFVWSALVSKLVSILIAYHDSLLKSTKLRLGDASFSVFVCVCVFPNAVTVPEVFGGTPAVAEVLPTGPAF